MGESVLLSVNSKLLNILIFLDSWNNPLHKEINDKQVIPIILKRFRNWIKADINDLDIQLHFNNVPKSS